MEYQYKTQPFEHQRKALSEGANKQNFAYLMEMGTGKTKVCIDNIAHLWLQNKISLALVVAPNSVYQNWKTEIEKHCPVDTTVHVYKIDKNKNFKPKAGSLNFLLMNVEAFSHKSGFDFINPIIYAWRERMCMVVDESTTIKNRKAKRTKTIIEVGQEVAYKRILTGSPVTKSPLDLFSQCQFLDKNILGTDNFFVFRARHCAMKHIPLPGRNVQIPLITHFMNLDDLERRLKQHSYRVKKEECLTLPDKIYQKRLVQLKGEQLSVYGALKQDARALFQDQEVSYNNKLTEIIKLTQVCNGFLKSDDGKITDLGNAKLQELLNILDELDGKAIIWADYIHNIKQIKEKLDKTYGEGSNVFIYGDVSIEDRQKAIKDFQTSDEVRFIVGNPTVGGYGLNLTKASTVIYFSNNFNLETRLQSEDRAHRIGQEKNVTYIDIIAEKTIDEFILKLLNKKLKISAETLGEEVLAYL
jgi:SNF2 family DNA or RNA helicase|tara:strand:+ start:802 stop:2214 length:1413 start_codon:yes stop_codon:yes gene_type:complete